MQFLCLLTALHKGVSKDAPPDELLLNSILLFEECQKHHGEPQVDRWLQQLQEQLLICRCKFVPRFKKSLQEAGLDQAVTLTEQLDGKLHSFFKTTFGIADWERELELFQSSFLEILAAKRLRGKLNSLYTLAARRIQILDCYLHWEKVLQQEEKSSLSINQRSIGNRWQTALKIKRLISMDKEMWLQQSLRQEPARASRAFAVNEASLENVLKRLSCEIEASKKRIAIAEKRLIGRLDWLSYCVSSIANVVMNSRYVQRANFLVESQACVMQEHVWKGTQPLTNFYLGLSKGITATGLLGLDLLEWSWTGLSLSIPDAIAQSLTPSHDSMINIFKKLRKGDDKTAIRYMPIFRNCIQFGVIVGFSGYLSSRSIMETGIAYSVAIGVSQCASECVDLFYKVKYGSKKCSSYPLVHGVAQMASFSLAGVYAVPLILGWWTTPSQNTMLTDPMACRAYPLECKKAACGVLGLPDTASPEEIRKTYRQLAMTMHPDQSSSDSRSTFREIVNAKKLCLYREKNFL